MTCRILRCTARVNGCALALSGLLMTACVSAVPPIAPSSEFRNEWVAQPNADPFSDEPVCRVTMAHVVQSSSPSFGFSYQQRAAVYPVVIKRGEAIFVGATRIPLQVGNQIFHQPVGDVQIRVDDASAWTIAAAETPSLGPKGSSAEIANAQRQKALESLQAANPFYNPRLISEMTEAMMASGSYLGSPVTLATGEKAARIFQQMKDGAKIMYRQFSGNAVGETNAYSLEGFKEAAAKCGL